MRLRRGLKEAVQIGMLSGQLGAPGDAQKSGGLVRNERWSKYICIRPQCTPLLRMRPMPQPSLASA